MELRHIRYFVAAAEETHFGRAAERLGISGPALGQQIRELEEELGVELFKRLPRGVRLTEAGRTLLADAYHLLGDVQRAVTRTQCVARGEAGVVRVGHVPDSILRSAPIASRLLPEFCVKYPGVEVQELQMSREDQLQAIEDGRIDFGIFYSAPDPSLGLTSELLDENFITGALLPASHPLARKRELRCEDLRALPCTASPDSLLGRELHAHGLDVQAVEPRMTDPSVMIGLVSVGAAWMPGSVWLEELVRSDAVIFREWADEPIRWPCCLVWRDSERSTLAEKFLSFARSLRAALISTTTSSVQIRTGRFRRSAGKRPA